MTTSNTQRFNFKPTTAAYPTWKRALDIVVSLIAITLMSPMILIVALMIKVISGGPIFFRQERMGYKGNRFKLLKFRSMNADADVSLHNTHSKDFIRSGKPMTKLDSKGDPRLITGGWLIRAAGIDELPQLINVMRGEMSIVGPRPCTPSEFKEYSDDQMKRFDVLPGLTGLWQVNGKNNTTFPEMIRLDELYCLKKSLMIDLGIMLRTPSVLIKQVLNAKKIADVQNPPSSVDEFVAG